MELFERLRGVAEPDFFFEKSPSGKNGQKMVKNDPKMGFQVFFVELCH